MRRDFSPGPLRFTPNPKNRGFLTPPEIPGKPFKVPSEKTMLCRISPEPLFKKISDPPIWN